MKTLFGKLRHPIAGWSSPVARQAHNLKAAGSNPAPATKFKPAECEQQLKSAGFSFLSRSPAYRLNGQTYGKHISPARFVLLAKGMWRTETTTARRRCD